MIWYQRISKIGLQSALRFTHTTLGQRMPVITLQLKQEQKKKNKPFSRLVSKDGISSWASLEGLNQLNNFKRKENYILEIRFLFLLYLV